MAKEVHRRDHSQTVDEDRTEDGDCANRHWSQDRDSMGLHYRPAIASYPATCRDAQQRAWILEGGGYGRAGRCGQLGERSLGGFALPFRPRMDQAMVSQLPLLTGKAGHNPGVVEIRWSCKVVEDEGKKSRRCKRE